MKNLVILLTGAGAPGAPGIISCYKNNHERNVKIIGVDVKSRVPTIQMLDAFEIVPPSRSLEFIPTLLKIAKKYNVDVIQPLVTSELEILSKNFSLFNKFRIKLCVSPIRNLIISNDKGLLFRKLESLKISIPKSYLIRDVHQFIEVAKKLNFPNFPICFKPTKANGSRGFRIIDSNINRFNLLFKEKPDSTYISYDEVINTFSNNQIPELLVMEYLPNDEYSVDLLVDHGKVLYCIPRLRLKMNGGISIDCVVKNNKEVISYTSKIAKKLKLHGNIGIQVRFSADNQIKILEINPRLQGTVVAVAAAGVNLPYLGVKLALNEKIPRHKVKWNIEMLRYWKEVYFDDSGSSFTY
jgi:carbamoyl-phosphate synthase large subunit